MNFPVAAPNASRDESPASAWLRLVCFAACFVTLVIPRLGFAQSAPPAPKTPPVCKACDKPISGNYFYFEPPGQPLIYVCATCEKLPSRCSICRVPVKNNFTKTDDGRYYCQHDAAQVVLDADEGAQLFEQTRGELRDLSHGALALRFPKVNVQLLFHLDFTDTRQNPGGAMHRTGFSMSRPAGEGWAHNVVLLSGQPRTLTRSTAAHEFGHLWLTENVPATRKLDPDVREAFCELLAYKLATLRRDTNEIARLKTNPYTKGAILRAIEFETRDGLPAVLAWARDGKTDQFPGQTTGTPNAVASTVATTNAANATNAPAGTEPTAPPVVNAPLLPELRPPPPPVTKLELRSLLRTSKRTIAVINGERFEPGTEISLLVGTKRHRVRLESTGENTVVVTVDGQRQTLQLGGN